MSYNVLSVLYRGTRNLLLVELLDQVQSVEIGIPTNLSKLRPVDHTLKSILNEFSMDSERYLYLARTEWVNSTEHLRIKHGPEDYLYTPRYPFWVYDKQDKKQRCFVLAPTGKWSLHRYLGAAYGYPQCCIDAYVKRIIDKKRKKGESYSVLSYDDYLYRLKGTGYLEFRKETEFEPCLFCSEEVHIQDMKEQIKDHAIVSQKLIDNNEHSWMLLMYLYINNRYKLWSNRTEANT